MAHEFWLSDAQWSAIEPVLPKVYSGARRDDDRRIISGIIHVLKCGCRGGDGKPEPDMPIICSAEMFAAIRDVPMAHQGN